MAKKVNTLKHMPQGKVRKTTFAAALATLIIGIVHQTTDIRFTPTQVGALGTILVGIVGYVTQPDEDDQIEVKEEK